MHKAINLLSQAAGLHWISSSNYNSKCLTVEIEMAKSSRIGQIEIGSLFMNNILILSLDQVI